ncbi:MAG: serpin family protein [Thermomicrobiales bacterium]|nr:serpin family protein [Thermomicrobiales bacterium]
MKRLPLLLVALLISPLVAGVSSAQTDQQSTLVAGNSTFAFDLYAQLRDSTDGNLVFSPYSVSQALAMTYAGARGETAEQLGTALAFGVEQDALPEIFSALNASLLERGSAEADESNGTAARALRIANALWGEETFPFDPDFTALLEAAYGAGIQPADFINDPEGTREAINAWVAEQTENRIQEIIPEGVLTPLTRLVLANAIYFYGAWQFTFAESATDEQDFHLLDGSVIGVPTMHQTEDFQYGAADGLQIVELPYQGSGMTFTILLPDEGAFGDFESSLSLETLNNALAIPTSTEIELYLPKFEFEYSAGLTDALKALGMTAAFDGGSADFTGMVDGTPPDPLVISDVLHKAFIAIDEDGTEAAAVTAVIVGAAAAAPDPTEPPVVRIDRPFVFVIRDVETGTILFLGRVLDPSA